MVEILQFHVAGFPDKEEVEHGNDRIDCVDDGFGFVLRLGVITKLFMLLSVWLGLAWPVDPTELSIFQTGSSCSRKPGNPIPTRDWDT